MPTLKAMQKKTAFYHDKDIDMLKLGCTLPNVANICLHKSTDANFYPFMEGEKDLSEKLPEDVVVGPSIVFTRRAVVDETFLRKSAKMCKSFVGIDASQLNPYSMCQPMPAGLYTCWDFVSDFESETSKFTPRQNKTRRFENMVMSYFQRTRPEYEIESFFTKGRRKLTASLLMGFVFIATLCLKTWLPFTTAVPVKSCVPLSLKRIFNVVARREKSMH